jgi:hypothetical protein
MPLNPCAKSSAASIRPKTPTYSGSVISGRRATFRQNCPAPKRSSAFSPIWPECMTFPIALKTRPLMLSFLLSAGARTAFKVICGHCEPPVRFTSATFPRLPRPQALIVGLSSFPLLAGVRQIEASLSVARNMLYSMNNGTRMNLSISKSMISKRHILICVTNLCENNKTPVQDLHRTVFIASTPSTGKVCPQLSWSWSRYRQIRSAI